MCGFSRQVGESQAPPKLQRLVATLTKRQQEEVEVRAQTKGAVRQEQVVPAKKRVQAARRAVEDVHERTYQKVVAEHERYMESVVPYKALRYIRELQEAGWPQEIGAVGLQDGRVTGHKREVLQKVAESFREQHNQGQQGLSQNKQRMIWPLPRVFTEDQSEAIHRSRVTLGEKKEAVRAPKSKKSPGPYQLVAEAYQNSARLNWILGGSSCMVKMRPKLPLHGTAKKKSFWGGPKTQEPKLL